MSLCGIVLWIDNDVIGGLWYLSYLHGLVCDNVVNSEVDLAVDTESYHTDPKHKVVLANGSIVNANAESNPDLWWALKGGGNNFGSVIDHKFRRPA